jgi:hypothetical protein
MNTRFYFISLASIAAVVLLAATPAAHSEPAARKSGFEATLTASNAIPRSVFTIPSSPREGRDPFFPNAGRSYAGAETNSTTSAAASAIILNGLSGARDHRLAMINGRTLAEGETNEVITAAGPVRIRCVEIKGESVVVEVIGGERRELHLRN